MSETNARVLRTGSGSAEAPMLIVHGGAGVRNTPYSEERKARVRAALAQALEAGMAVLDAGGEAIDAVVAAVHVMEDCPEFNSAHGAALTRDGRAELDSCLMKGDGSVGSVAGTTTARNPIDAARAVMEMTPHVLVAAPRPEQLASWGVEQVDNAYFVTEYRKQQLAELLAREAAQEADAELDDERHGTIGVVARDAAGNLCAGTSTGGITDQIPGRIGDAPICGCGTYANQATCAVSCTGTGEKFIQEVAGYQVHARMLWGGEEAGAAVKDVLEAVTARGGDGGIICIPVHGEGVVARTWDAEMNWAYAYGKVRETHS